MIDLAIHNENTNCDRWQNRSPHCKNVCSGCSRSLFFFINFVQRVLQLTLARGADKATPEQISKREKELVRDARTFSKVKNRLCLQRAPSEVCCCRTSRTCGVGARVTWVGEEPRVSETQGGLKKWFKTHCYAPVHGNL